MIRLAAVLYSIVGTTLAGGGVIAVLAMGQDTATPIIAAAVSGAVIALPVSYVLAGKILDFTAK